MPAKQEPDAVIETRMLTKVYPGPVTALDGLAVTVAPGVTGLVGANGAGKSTILHMIAGFLPPSWGELTVGSRPSWRNPAIYRRIGLVPERDSVYAFLTR